jgi:hypothetical protein
MSSDSVKIVGTAWREDTKQIELIQNVIEKTKLGKITWQKAANSLVANVPGMQLSFVRSAANSWTAILGGGGGWDIFSIRSQQGAEIIKVEQLVGNIFFPPTTTPVPTERSKLLQTVDTLYAVADAKVESGEIDKAINVIKNL